MMTVESLSNKDGIMFMPSMFMPKLFASEKSAKATLRRQGLDGMKFEIIPVVKMFFVEIEVDNEDDFNEVRERGFAAKRVDAK